MNPLKAFPILTIALLLLAGAGNLRAQSGYRSTCAAVFLDINRVADGYEASSKSQLKQDAQGIFSIREDIGEQHTNGLKVPFRVAIRKQKFSTLYLFSDSVYTELDIAGVMAQCEPGDRIVFLVEGEKWALPHHEVEVTE